MDDPVAIKAESEQANLELAQTQAAKAAREEAEASSPTAVALRSAEAAQKAGDARRAQVAALIPDFSKLSGTGMTFQSAGQPTAGTGVGAEALRRAGEKVATAVLPLASGNGSLLVMTDDDLASSDAAYCIVNQEVARYSDLVASALTQSNVDVVAPTGADAVASRAQMLVGPLDVASAVAQAVPSILSLFTSHRTVTTGTDSPDDTAASMMVAGALKRVANKRKVFHDSMRTVPGGTLSESVVALRVQRERLAARKLELEKRKPAASGEGPTAEILTEAIAVATSTLASLDTFLENLFAIPSGATRSPLTTAQLRQGLHDGTFAHVLIVKAQSSSAMQDVDDRPFWFKDTFAVLGVASIAWTLVGTSDGTIAGADISIGTAQAYGKIGEKFEILES